MTCENLLSYVLTIMHIESTVELPPLWLHLHPLSIKVFNLFDTQIHHDQLRYHYVKIKAKFKTLMGFDYSWVPKPSHGAFSLNKKKVPIMWFFHGAVEFIPVFPWANLHVCGQCLLQGEGSLKLHVQQHEVPWRLSVTPLPCLFSSLSFSCLDFGLGEPWKRT
jgi:hypothetical protein